VTGKNFHVKNLEAVVHRLLTAALLPAVNFHTGRNNILYSECSTRSCQGQDLWQLQLKIKVTAATVFLLWTLFCNLCWRI